MVIAMACHLTGCCCVRFLLTKEMVVAGSCGHLGFSRNGHMQGLRLNKGICHLLSEGGKYSVR